MELNPEGSTMILRRTNPPAPPTCPLPCGLARLQTHPWLDSVPIRAAFFRPQESSHKSPLRTPPPIPCRALLLAVEMSQFPSPHRQFPGSFHHSCHRVAVVIPIQASGGRLPVHGHLSSCRVNRLILIRFPLH
uniref:Uncharacterized protein n=1 Tax=Setaria viridis TaxID=4556 RepID=A0A4U6SVW2_SETVI|nr:hypothetical protein SEVIR_9G161900v2 [Setaria viridis]